MPRPTTKLTKAKLDTLRRNPPAKGKRINVTDGEIKGYFARVFPSGTVALRFQYGPSHDRKVVPLGKYPGDGVTPAELRRRAEVMRGRVVRGEDPAGDRRVAALTGSVADVVAAYIERRRARRKIKESTLDTYARILAIHVAPYFGGRRALELDRDDAAAFHAWASDPVARPEGRGGPGIANRAVTLLGAAWRHILPGQPNPWAWGDGLERNDGTRGNRVPTGGERTAIFEHLTALEDSGTMRPGECDCIRFIIFSGMRSSEAASLRWSEIDWLESRIYKADTKKGARDHYPTPRALDLLKRRRKASKRAGRETDGDAYVFGPEDSRGVDPHGLARRFRKRVTAPLGIYEGAAGKTPLVLHSFRHGIVTAAKAAGHGLAGGALVGHASRDATERYDHVDAAFSRKVAADAQAQMVAEEGDA